MAYNGKTIIVIGNLDYRDYSDVTIKVPGIKNENIVIPVKIKSIPVIDKGKITEKIMPGEIQVLVVNDLELK